MHHDHAVCNVARVRRAHAASRCCSRGHQRCCCMASIPSPRAIQVPRCTSAAIFSILSGVPIAHHPRGGCDCETAAPPRLVASNQISGAKPAPTVMRRQAERRGRAGLCVVGWPARALWILGAGRPPSRRFHRFDGTTASPPTVSRKHAAGEQAGLHPLPISSRLLEETRDRRRQRGSCLATLRL